MIGSALKNLFGKPYTIGELMSIDQARQGKALQSSVSLVDTFFTLKEEGIASKFKSLFTGNTIKTLYITLKLKVISDTGNPHYVFIQLDPDYSTSGWYGNKVHIYCDCNDFKYRSAYALSKRGSLFDNQFTRISLGQALTEAPKRGTNVLCKHGYAALNWLMSNYKNIMSTI